MAIEITPTEQQFSTMVHNARIRLNEAHDALRAAHLGFALATESLRTTMEAATRFGCREAAFGEYSPPSAEWP